MQFELHSDEINSQINHKIGITNIQIEILRESPLLYQSGMPHSFVIEPEQLDNLRGKHDLAIDSIINNYQELVKDLTLHAFMQDNKIYVSINIDKITKLDFETYL